MNLDLSNKRALVTGNSRGIGEAIAKALAREGVSVIIHGRNESEAKHVAQAISDSDGETALALGSLDTDEGASEVAQAALNAFDGIDIVINSAGSALGDSSDAPDAAAGAESITSMSCPRPT